MASSTQGHHGGNDPTEPSRLPSLLSEVPGGSPPPPTAATGLGGSREGTAVGLPKLTGINTLNQESEKDEKEEAERRKQIVSVNQKTSRTGPAAVRRRSSSEGDSGTSEPLPYQPQCFNEQSPSLRRVEVVGLSLPTLPGRPEVTNHVQPTSRLTKDRSSTMAREGPQTRRHGEMWSSAEQQTTQKPRSFILHTNRYQPFDSDNDDDSENVRCYSLWDDLLHSPEGLTQKERHEVEEAYQDRLRSLKRTREAVPHRETRPLVMGGTRVMMTERMDIMGEIAKLKSVLLPARAKDLYVGKGFKLPGNHALNKPRGFTISNKNKNKRATPSPETPALHIGKPPTKERNVVPVSSPVSSTTSPAKSASPTKGPAVNPLEIKGLEKLVSDEELETLRRTFKNLSTSAHGQVKFDELKSHLPNELTEAEMEYCRKVYEISSSRNLFGENEFVFLSCVCQQVVSLSGATKDAFQSLRFHSIGDSISQYAELFQSVDRHQTGNISVESLIEILSATTGRDLRAAPEKCSEITSAVGLVESTEISKAHFLALVPYFLELSASK